jgi:hypothetical protein
MMVNMEVEREIIRQQADEGVQREKEKLSNARNSTEEVTTEMASLSERLAAAIAPIPEPNDVLERRRIYIRKLKKAEAKAATVKMMLGKDDKALYDRSRDVFNEQSTRYID